MKPLPSLTVFFPTLNDAQGLPSLLEKTYDILPKVAKSYEVIVINDGSTDNTAEVMAKLQKKYKTLGLITHKKNRGYGGALISGFAHAKKEWIFYTDGDGQYDPRDIEKLVKKLGEDIDVVNGIKIERSDSAARKYIGEIYNKVLRYIYNIPISDIDCDFRLIRKSCINKISLTSRSGIICLELVLKLHKVGARFAEVKVPHHPRKYGSSQFFRPKHLLNTLVENIVFYMKWRNK